MEANEAPEKIYINSNLENRTWLIGKGDTSFIEYTHTDDFIEKACEFLFQYNKNQVLKHGVKATLSCVEYTINVDDFKNYMKGE